MMTLAEFTQFMGEAALGMVVLLIGAMIVEVFRQIFGQ